MHTCAKYQGKILFVSVFMVALLTNFAFANGYEFTGCDGLWEISTSHENGCLVFTIIMPHQMGDGDFILLWLDYEPSDQYSDGSVMVWHSDWAYTPPPFYPSWMTVEPPEDTNNIEIAIDIDESPLGSEPFYRFALQVQMGACKCIYPPELTSFDPEDTSEWRQEELLPEFVIPETPLGTITALTSMVFAFILYRKIGH